MPNTMKIEDVTTRNTCEKQRHLETELKEKRIDTAELQS